MERVPGGAAGCPSWVPSTLVKSVKANPGAIDALILFSNVAMSAIPGVGGIGAQGVSGTFSILRSDCDAVDALKDQARMGANQADLVALVCGIAAPVAALSVAFAPFAIPLGGMAAGMVALSSVLRPLSEGRAPKPSDFAKVVQFAAPLVGEQNAAPLRAALKSLDDMVKLLPDSAKKKITQAAAPLLAARSQPVATTTTNDQIKASVNKVATEAAVLSLLAGDTPFTSFPADVGTRLAAVETYGAAALVKKRAMLIGKINAACTATMKVRAAEEKSKGSSTAALTVSEVVKLLEGTFGPLDSSSSQKFGGRLVATMPVCPTPAQFEQAGIPIPGVTPVKVAGVPTWVKVASGVAAIGAVALVIKAAS